MPWPGSAFTVRTESGNSSMSNRSGGNAFDEFRRMGSGNGYAAGNGTGQQREATVGVLAAAKPTQRAPARAAARARARAPAKRAETVSRALSFGPKRLFRQIRRDPTGRLRKVRARSDRAAGRGRKVTLAPKATADHSSTSGRKRNSTMTVNSVNSVSFSPFSTFGSASPTASTATADASSGSTASGTTPSVSSAAASSGTGGTGQVDTITKTGTTSGYGLSTDDFMKLFLAQLQNQDPTKPMDDSQMLNQLAQMTQVQTLQGVESALKGSQLAQSSALIGKTVTGTDVNGTAVTGVVGSVVQSTDAGLVLKVGSQYVKPDDVTTVTAGS